MWTDIILVSHHSLLLNTAFIICKKDRACFHRFEKQYDGTTKYANN